MKRLTGRFAWMILLGFLATNLLVVNLGWTADNDSQGLSAPPAWIYLPLILTNVPAPTPAQKAAIHGAAILLLATDEES
jgi:hypothetical protein